uniref:Uncharacterized protein n=1 Tax=Aegilops tauschii subsp. strangulata TaxID=200361 RepID=A0A453Q3S8_AEGTS
AESPPNASHHQCLPPRPQGADPAAPPSVLPPPLRPTHGPCGGAAARRRAAPPHLGRRRARHRHRQPRLQRRPAALLLRGARRRRPAALLRGARHRRRLRRGRGRGRRRLRRRGQGPRRQPRRRRDRQQAPQGPHRHLRPLHPQPARLLHQGHVRACPFSFSFSVFPVGSIDRSISCGDLRFGFRLRRDSEWDAAFNFTKDTSFLNNCMKQTNGKKSSHIHILRTFCMVAF